MRSHMTFGSPDRLDVVRPPGRTPLPNFIAHPGPRVAFLVDSQSAEGAAYSGHRQPGAPALSVARHAREPHSTIRTAATATITANTVIEACMAVTNAALLTPASLPPCRPSLPATSIAFASESVAGPRTGAGKAANRGASSWE